MTPGLKLFVANVCFYISSDWCHLIAVLCVFQAVIHWLNNYKATSLYEWGVYGKMHRNPYYHV